MAKYVISDSDYLDLWKHFQTQADVIKESMFQSVTWIIGFAGAVLGFNIVKFLDFQSSGLIVQHKPLAISFCVVGLILCLYAFFLLKEFASHIEGNWDRAKAALEEVSGLTEIIDAAQSKQKFGQIWHKMAGVTLLFVISFISEIVLFVTAATKA